MWGSRRAGARTRRKLVQQALAGSVIEPELRQAPRPADRLDTMELPAVAAGRPELEQFAVVALSPVQGEGSRASALLARIRAYTDSSVSAR
jgi:hypothetical protein